MGNVDYTHLLEETKIAIENRGDLLSYEICKGRSSPHFGEKYNWLENEMEKNNLNNFSDYHIFAFSPKKNSLDDVILSVEGIKKDVLALNTPSHFYSASPRWEYEVHSKGHGFRDYLNLNFDFGGISYSEKKDSLKLNLKKEVRSVASFDEKYLKISKKINENNSADFALDNLKTKELFFEFDILENIVILPYLNKHHFEKKYSSEKEKLLHKSFITRGFLSSYNHIFDRNIGSRGSLHERTFEDIPTTEIESFVSLIKSNGSFIGGRHVVFGEDKWKHSIYSISEIKRLIADEEKQKKSIREQKKKKQLVEEEKRLKESLKETEQKLAILKKKKTN